jgi:hypothetical protein
MANAHILVHYHIYSLPGALLALSVSGVFPILGAAAFPLPNPIAVVTIDRLVVVPLVGLP